MQNTKTALLRRQPRLSTAVVTSTSKAATAERNAAKNSKPKNNAAKIEPPLICPKMLGTVIKVSDGPLSRSSPKATAAGTMTNPANTAASVSPSPMDTAVVLRLVLAGR